MAITHNHVNRWLVNPAVVLDRQFLGEEYQSVLEDVKDYIKELTRVELKHGGVNVHYFSWTAISLKKGKGMFRLRCLSWTNLLI